MKKRIFQLILLLFLPLAANAAGIAYLDGQGMEKTYTGTASEVTSVTEEWTAGWYVVNSNVTVSDRITVTGDVHLILLDGKTLTAEMGISVEGESSLTVYAQSVGKSTMGALIANAGKSDSGTGIGSAFGSLEECGKITINGGRIEAYGGNGYYGSAGIGGREGKITINGGYITAVGGTASYGAGAGIGGSGQSQNADSVIITGGVIKATGGLNGAAGIGGGGHDGILKNFSITGGWIEAEGNYRHGQNGQGNANAIGGGANKNSAFVMHETMVLIDRKIMLGHVYGNAVLSGDAALEENVILNVLPNATLTVPAGLAFAVDRHARIVNQGIIYTDVSLPNTGTVYHITHHVIYEAEGSKLRVRCGNSANVCTLGTNELTLFAPLKTMTTDNESPEALLIGENWPEEAQAPAVGYEELVGGEYVPLSAAPTQAGRYRAYAAAGNAKATVEYEIKAPELPAPLPETGDGSNLVLMCALMLLAVGGMCLGLRKAKG
ncbi:MAG: hypothetical protein IKW00_09330 [Clostridia bacterium]|nr:hypothetical protein [Clostridia bacterium]